MSTELEAVLDVYEVLLSKSAYLAGDELTLADLFHLPLGASLAPSGVKLLEEEGKRPNVARWWKKVTGRESWKAVNA